MKQILYPYLVTLGSGSTITLGVCPCCGRRLSLSSANKTGARCRYEGAQFSASGQLLRFTWRENGKVQKLTTPDCAEHVRLT